MGSAKFRLTAVLAELPATSNALTTMLLPPCASVRLQVNAVPVMLAGVPLQFTALTPETASETRPWMLVCAELRLVPVAGEMMVITGEVLSILTEILARATLPTASVTVPLINRSRPSVVVGCEVWQLIGGTPPEH